MFNKVSYLLISKIYQTRSVLKNLKTFLFSKILKIKNRELKLRVKNQEPKLRVKNQESKS